MKFLLLLVFCSSVVANTIMSDVDFYNMLRQKFAQTNGVPNMWKLRQSNILETLARIHVPEDCSLISTATVNYGYRYYLTDGGEAAKKFDAYWIKWLAETEKTNPEAVTAKNKEWELNTAFFLEYVNPIQTMVGCIPRVCTVKPEPRKEYPKFITYKRMCLFGPYGHLGMYLPLNETSGVRAGSACGPDGKNEGGLCVLK